jgi:hypothetical protein
MDTFNVFIIFPNETSVADAVKDEVTYRAYLNTTKDLIDRADCEKGVHLYYNDSEKKVFINALTLLAESGEFYLLDPNVVINELLRNAIDCTTSEQKQQETAFYALWDFDSRQIVPTIPPSVKEAYKYQNEAGMGGKSLLLNIGNEFYPQKKALFVFRDSSTYADAQMPVFVKIDNVNHFEDLNDWFKQNRTLRQLNTIDQRHNEQSPNYDSVRGKSPLLYDLSRNAEAVLHVQSLLNEAISDQYANKDLMNYDLEKERYIWFEYENDNPQNQYHAYHLAKPMSHEEDTNAVSRIPERAKRFIDKQNEL